MARESIEKKTRRTALIIRKLKKYYPDARCALDHDTPLQLLVATVLSAQCTDERVNQVTKKLFAKYKGVEDFASADLAELEGLVRPTGFFKNKARAIKTAAQKIISEHGGDLPRTMEEMVALPGVGRKTANVVLGNAFGLATGVVVDTHVKRLSYRLGLSDQKTPEKIEKDLEKLVPRKDWINFSHWLIFHGRRVCKARSPQCHVCFLFEECPQRGVDARTKSRS